MQCLYHRERPPGQRCGGAAARIEAMSTRQWRPGVPAADDGVPREAKEVPGCSEEVLESEDIGNLSGLSGANTCEV